MFTVFFSWQSDIDPLTNRYFIRDALKLVIKDLMRDAEIDECPRLDHDTAGEPGNPDVADVVESKIAKD